MQIDHINFSEFPQLSGRDKSYQSNDLKLSPFLKFPFEYSSIKEALEIRKEHPVDRRLLVSQLKEQYQGVQSSEQTKKNIESLLENNTFTVITAHQPSLFTGPFYYIIKIASTINLASKINKDNPELNVVPVFIIGAEDHDFEEINHTYLFNKKIEWNREASGAVGRLSNLGLDEAILQYAQILGDNEHADALRHGINKAYENSNNYGEFSFLLTHFLFDKYGVVIANFDNAAFKNRFSTIIFQEIFEEKSKKLVVHTQSLLNEVGFTDQAYARDINFFYLKDKKRSRIERDGEKFNIIGTNISFTKDEMKLEIENHPECFSPNVIMRPLYQELIMPNLAYIGGGGEIAYWMERKSQFEAFNIPFPVLIRRNSVLWINGKQQKQLDKLNLEIKDLLKHPDQLVKSIALRESVHDTDFTKQLQEIETTYVEISNKATSIDGSLSQKLEAMKVSHINAIEKLQSRLIKTIKNNQEVKLNQVRKIQESLFPGFSLQERKMNFAEIYLQHGDKLFETLIELCYPFNKGFIIISDQ